MSTENSHEGGRAHASPDRLLLHAGRQATGWSIVLALTALAAAAVTLALPLVLGHAVDGIVTGDGGQRWLVWCGLLVAVLVACSALDDLATGAVVARSTAWLRHTLLERLLAAGIRGDGLGAGEVTARLVGNAAEAGRVAPAAIGAVTSTAIALGGVVALALIDPWLCAAFLSGMPLLLWLVRAFALDASALASRYLETQGQIAARLVEAIAGARTIAASGTLQREVQRTLEPLPDLRRHGLQLWRASMRITTQDTLLVAALEIAVLAVAGLLLSRGQITPGEMLAASQYVLLASGLGSLANIVARLTRARAAAARIAMIVDVPAVRHGTRTPAAGGGRLEFRGVTVRSGDETVFDAIDLVIPAGALVGVVGRSGSGKSLLAALGGRLTDPDEGTVLLDGVDLRELDRHALRRAVTYGFAQPALFGATVADAIAFGCETAPHDRVVAAAGDARADDFIRRLPVGYATPLAQTPMSGGERQRIGLARTFAHAGRVVILDDVAASLDTVTEHHVSAAITTALCDRTRIVVAHRTSTAARMDAVVWLDGGAVRGVAPHSELWEDAEYRAVFEPEDVAEPPQRPRLAIVGGGAGR
ncbi:MAG TPA: ABC transporter ATP-binding protein [Solirubrobacteraceae bacterium]|jgi:ATP-binding cassette subfamily B protein|nr:ABC transporter ATP-binding protein [Solirubrobacteraceae bacterium]